MKEGSLLRKNLVLDQSLWLLVFSNIVTIYFATNENWSLFDIMWVYWLQSVIIGIFNFIRILQLKEFSTEGFRINNRPAEPTEHTKKFTAFFFLLHYGFFHFGYMAFLLAGPLSAGTAGAMGSGFKYILPAALLFFFNHFFSYFYNRPRDTKKQNIGTLMFYPYARIIPMHFMIAFFSVYGGSLVLFLGLKTLADVIMHIVEHNLLRKGEESPVIT